MKSNEEWRKQLSPEEFRVAREKGTEPPFTGRYWNNHEEGMYRCVCCGAPLFRSQEKFESGSGWPSFTAPAEEANIQTERDTSHSMERVEVQCSQCGAHLGHVFPDGPRPAGLRYCINSASLKFEPIANSQWHTMSPYETTRSLPAVRPRSFGPNLEFTMDPAEKERPFFRVKLLNRDAW